MFKRNKPKTTPQHVTINVKHTRLPDGCRVWLICSCGTSHAYATPASQPPISLPPTDCAG